MKLPVIAKVGAIYYQILPVKNLTDGDKKLDGMTDIAKATISADADLAQQAGVQTLLHELVHVVSIQMGYPDLDDNIVDAIAYSAYQVLRDNPLLVRAIMK